MERPAKRARTSGDEKDGVSPIGALPDAVLCRVFEQLDIDDVWRLRGVCGRWRAAIRAHRWPRVSLPLARGPELLRGAAALVRDGRLRVRGGADVDLFLQPWNGADDDRWDLTDEERERFRAPEDPDDPYRSGYLDEMSAMTTVVSEHVAGTFAAAASLLAEVHASACRDGPAGRLGDVFVSVKLAGECYGTFPISNYARDVAASLLLAVLGAVQPLELAAGKPASGGAATIAIHLSLPPELDADRDDAPVLPPRPYTPSAPDLRALLEPLGGALRSLNLASLDSPAYAIDERAAKTIAEYLAPSLRSADLPLSSPAAVAAMGAISGLEDLNLFEAGEKALEGLEELAASPAGRSLRRLILKPTCDGAVLRALTRFPALETLRGIKIGKEGAALAVDELAALGRIPSLRSLDVILDLSGEGEGGGEGGGEGARALLALRAAAHPDLAFRLTLSGVPEAAGVEILEAFAGRLASLDLACPRRALARREVAALVAARPRLTKATVACSLMGALPNLLLLKGLAPLRPGASLELEVSLVPRPGPYIPCAIQGEIAESLLRSWLPGASVRLEFDRE
eukprot:tig00020723_g13503.t1